MIQKLNFCVIDKRETKNKCLFIISLLFLCNCTSTKNFVDPDNEVDRSKFNTEIKGKEVLIYQSQENLPIVSEFTQITSDSIYYFDKKKYSAPLDSVEYLKIDYKLNILPLIVGGVLIGVGINTGSKSNDAVSLGEALGKSYEGAFFVLLGVGVGALSFLPRDKYFYFREEIKHSFDRKSNEKSCRNPRFKKRCSR